MDDDWELQQALALSMGIQLEAPPMAAPPVAGLSEDQVQAALRAAFGAGSAEGAPSLVCTARSP